MIEPSDRARFPVPTGRFWAKLHPRENPTEWHPLIAHSADVAAVMERLLHPDSVLAHRLAQTLGAAELTPEQRTRLVFLAALHDLGKTSHGFQTKGYPKGQRGGWNVRGHVTVVFESMDVRELKQLVGSEILPVLGRDMRTAAMLFSTAVAHHGRPWPLDDQKPADQRNRLWLPDDSGRDPLAEMRRLIRHARRWSGVDDLPGDGFTGVSPEFTHLFAGALTLADWIGSTRSAFGFAPEADDDPDTYWETARKRAARACARIGIVPDTRPVSADLTGMPLLQAVFADVFGSADGEAANQPRNAPTPLQTYVADMDLPPPGSRLLIESETGSGKTEAALALYARLRASGQVGGLMFALPTRATASAMYERVQRALKGMYTGEHRPTVTLAVGGRQPHLHSDEELIRELSDTYPDEADRELARWASSGAKKFLAAEIVVGTIDQVLLGGLPVKHAHLRLAALSRHLLVVDELHSYDRYMTTVLGRVLDLFTGAGGTALFMSATLSHEARREYGGGAALGREEAQELPYPVLSTHVPGSHGWTNQSFESASTPKTVRWRAIGADQVVAEAIAAAEAGARVLLLRNTVRAARETSQAIREAGHESLLWQTAGTDGAMHTPAYHSRYTVPDRLELDERIRKRFGKPAAAVTGGVILISTQVAEQSLDVDFDLLITDLCPIDVLLQRIGRVHRHGERNRHRPPGYRETAEVWVIAPEGGFAGRLETRSVQVGWGENRPYSNYADGELTLRTIACRPEVEIPRDNRTLVEAVYHPDAREELWEEPEWEAYRINPEGVELGQLSHARSAALNFAQTYTASAGQFTAAAETGARTRLGDETIRIELPEPVRCLYARPPEPVRHVDLPAWALPKGKNEERVSEGVIWTAAAGEAARFRLLNHTYWYDEDGWDWSGG